MVRGNKDPYIQSEDFKTRQLKFLNYSIEKEYHLLGKTQADKAKKKNILDKNFEINFDNLKDCPDLYKRKIRKKLSTLCLNSNKIAEKSSGKLN